MSDICQHSSDTSSAYDAIAPDYDRDSQERGDRVCILKPSARHYCGDLRGASVLDLACGSGYFTRLVKAWGASRVVGIDLSAEMIRLAEEDERRRPLGLVYQIGDVASLGRVGEFDLIFAGFLLHYAADHQELGAMARAISLNLRPGGRLVSFNENPFRPVHEGIRYDVAAAAVGPLQDGCRVQRTHYRRGQPEFVLNHQHFEPAAYEGAFRQAGLTAPQWRRFVAAPETLGDFPPGYWDEYLGDFSIAVLLAERV